MTAKARTLAVPRAVAQGAGGVPAILEEESLMPMSRSMPRGWAPVATRWLLALCCTLLASAALAQQPSTAGGGAKPEATVSLYNRPIAVFRAPFLGLSPAERAERTQRAISD